jgi:hypothetical protein
MKYFVMPHLSQYPSKKHCHSREGGNLWMPAFAGMTFGDKE